MLRRLGSLPTAARAAAAAGGATLFFATSGSALCSSSPTYELRYFDGRGAVETTRLLMALSGTPFVDTKWAMDMSRPYGQRCVGFMAAKASGSLVANLDRAPILIVDGTHEIGESKAIERFVARRVGLFGRDDIEGASIDAFCEHIRDLKQMFASAEDKPKFAKETLPTMLKKMETKAAAASGGGDSSAAALVGQALSLADVALYELLHEHFPARQAYLRGKGAGGGDVDISPDALLRDCPRLSAAVAAVKEHPGVAKHLATRSYTAPW